MPEGFYKTNGEVLKFNVIKDSNKILFNHYICQKENLQRIRGDLPKGQFYLTINSISKDLGITFAEARGLLKKFAELRIITNVYTPQKGSKKPSIWQYNSVIFTNNDENNQVNNDNINEKPSAINNLNSASNNSISNEKNNDVNNSKKENIKREYKNNSNNNKGYDLIINSYTKNEELKTAILEFIKMRKAIKKPVTDRALILILNKADKLAPKDEEKVQILNQSIENCWQGIYPLKSRGIVYASDDNKQQNYSNGYGWDHIKKFA